MNIIEWNYLDKLEQKKVLSRPAQDSYKEIAAAVSAICEHVKAEGDVALKDYVAKFDHCDRDQLELSQEEIKEACDRLDPELKAAIDRAWTNIYNFHAAQEPSHITMDTVPGITCRTATHGIDSVGLYVPGGSAPLVSTALMLGIPALIAGCKNVELASPYPISDAIIYAATKSKITHIFGMGGAHAIAAMAYGTASVPKVNKIFGPGNQFVTMAKAIVSDDPEGAAIDMPAGPSEVLVIADAFADPDFVAADLLSQAEHGPDSQVMLVSDSRELLEKTSAAVEEQLQALPRIKIATASLSKSRFILCENLAQCAEVSNTYAPEHLIVQTQDPEALVPVLHNAGSIFLGAYTCESMGDYASGTNHTLPTYGHARTFSALGTDDFRRRYTISCASVEGLKNIGHTVEALADAEGLFAHRNAVSLRLKKLDQGV